jgi:hypothetical protein
MLLDLIEQVAAPQPKRANLLLHCGSSAVSRGELAVSQTPLPTATHKPVSHMKVLQIVEQALLQRCITITGQAHGLSHNGARYFGLLEVMSPSDAEMHWVVGIRNSHDKRFSAGIVAGAQVLVCDNLSFNGEVMLARKHTGHIHYDLPIIAERAVDGLRGFWYDHTQRVEASREKRLTDTRAHDLVVRSVDAGVMANSYLPKVLQEWREPSHDAFAPRNVWSLQNAFTEVFKGRVDLLPERTMKLHQLLDAHVGLN